METKIRFTTVGEITNFARELLDKHGLSDWQFRLDRAKRRAGCCHHHKKLITLSRFYVAYNNVEDITDTILHEAGHALAGPGIGHDKVWQDICIRIGAKPERCYREHVVMPPSKYHAKCGKCQKEYDAHRMRQGKKYWCPKCGREDGKLLFSRRT